MGIPHFPALAHTDTCVCKDILKYGSLDDLDKRTQLFAHLLILALLIQILRGGVIIREPFKQT